MAQPWRLQTRILIPFVLVAIGSVLVVAAVALSVVSRALESRVISQVQNAASVISQSEFALNPAILQSASKIAGADIVTYQSDGTVLATTLSGPGRDAELKVVATVSPNGTLVSDHPPDVRRMPCVVPCLVAYASVATRPGTQVAVVVETSERATAMVALSRTILLTAGGGLLVMILVSQVVTRRVTAPLETLVAFTRAATPGASGRRAPAGDDEVGRLGHAFNEMLDRLDQSRASQVRSEKLALAGLLAARVAHDIRNPLASMKMQAQMLAAELRRTTSVTTGVDAILRDIQQLESVVRDLIELARPGELRREPTSVTRLMDDVLEQLSAQLSYRKIVVQREMSDGLPMVSLDAARFRQVLLNVIGNAADAMYAGGILTVRTHLDGDHLVLDIIDNGAGIDPAIRDRLFDPFVSTKRDGVGLGLVNSKAVVEQHGGRIELASADGQGTRARIILPIAVNEDVRS